MKLPPVTVLSYSFTTDTVNAIEKCIVNIEMNRINAAQAITGYSKILSAGYNEYNSNNTKFIDVTLPDVAQIVSGQCSMIALTKQGCVYGRGQNEFGELVSSDHTMRTEWTEIEKFQDVVKQVAYNNNHALFLTEDGQVFSCGSNVFGSLVWIHYFLLLL